MEDMIWVVRLSRRIATCFRENRRLDSPELLGILGVLLCFETKSKPHRYVLYHTLNFGNYSEILKKLWFHVSLYHFRYYR
jgi:hypothetical protein